ncbi:MAG: glutaminyl-peptide cyclotransferase [Flavobacteriaceae bacterium]|nr:glutaminyl-peptide cyclotransferase [Flavobacteriaceae bacterium]
MKQLLIILLSLVVFSSCKTEYKLKLETPKTLSKEGKFTAKVSEKNAKIIDSVLYSLNGKKLSTNNNFDLSKERLGKHVIAAVVFYEGKNKKLTNTITKLARKAPDYYRYEIIATYNHDPEAFTQGLEFYNGYLYESTGQRGASTIRKVDLKTGKVLKKESIDAKYFGEGMTIFNNKIHVLTWEAKEGLIYNLETFEQERTFNYGKSVQGWGFTHNDTHLIKSDGTKRIWFLDPKTHKEISFIEAYTNKKSTSRGINKLNELEYVKGKIYANVWQKNFILIINPKDGTIEGVADLNGLQKKAGQSGESNVLNGIAYDTKNDKLYVTGKNWNKLFEIKLTKK